MSIKEKRELYNAILATATSCTICFVVVLLEQLVLTKTDLLKTYIILVNVIISIIAYLIMCKLVAPTITEKIIVRQIKRSKQIFFHHKEKDGYNITGLHLVEIKSLNSIECVDVNQNKYSLSKKDLKSLFY